VEKPWFIGFEGQEKAKRCPISNGRRPKRPCARTPLYEIHKSLGAKMVPFAGWEMPVWYSSVVEEHLATRQAAGLFDVSHMGVYQVEGPDAASFLDSVCANSVGSLRPGESLYSHLLDPDANVIDDTLVYRRTEDKFLMVVNASNDDKDRAWLEAVRDGKVKIDNAPARQPHASATRPSSATCATRRPARRCAWTLPCKAPRARISCWPWASAPRRASACWRSSAPNCATPKWAAST
jgi:hypothetical protein